MLIRNIHPEGWKKASGYSNGISVQGARDLVFIAGQVAWDADQNLVGADDFAAQFECALANVVTVLRTAGGTPEHLVQMTVYVTDKRAYLDSVKKLGPIWREQVGATYPTMALVQVAGLVEDGAMVEIQATAAIE